MTGVQKLVLAEKLGDNKVVILPPSLRWKSITTSFLV